MTSRSSGLLNRLGRLLDRGITGLAKGLALLGGMGLIFAILVTSLSVLLKVSRRVLNALIPDFATAEGFGWLKPVLGEEELVQYAVGIALFSALPWVMLKRGHIRIDIFEPLFGKVANRILDFLADAALLSLAYLILTRQWFLIFKKARRSQEPLVDLLAAGDWTAALGRLRVNPESQILGLKLWPFYVFAEVCVLLFVLVALYCTVRSLIAIVKPGREAAH